MHSVMDTKSTIIVCRDGNDFIVKDLSSTETVAMNSSEFYGGCFKYESEFLRKFKTAFKDKEIKNIILSYEASDYMTDLIYFNRIDS